MMNALEGMGNKLKPVLLQYLTSLTVQIHCFETAASFQVASAFS